MTGVQAALSSLQATETSCNGQDSHADSWCVVDVPTFAFLLAHLVKCGKTAFANVYVCRQNKTCTSSVEGWLSCSDNGMEQHHPWKDALKS
jgi:hypothetical protein